MLESQREETEGKLQTMNENKGKALIRELLNGGGGGGFETGRGFPDLGSSVPNLSLCCLYNVQMDAAVLGDRLPEVTQSLSSAQAASLCSAGIGRARKCLQG